MESRIKELEKENNELKLIIQLLTREIEELKAKLNMNSSNSSLPPSSDRFKKKDKKQRSLRQKSEKSSGGQIGHKGSTLQKVQTPDFVVELPNDTCTNCSHDLTDIKANAIKSRQVFDIPEIKINVTEFRAHSKICPHCNAKTTSEFPKNVSHSAQYGANIRALILNLNIYQSLPYKRLQELLNDVFNLKLSQGTIYNTLKSGYTKLEAVEGFFKEQLAKSSVAHADETGTKVNGINRWIHSFSNDSFTVLSAHKNRGKKALVEAGIIEKFNGILAHDCWYAYDSFNHLTHALCWAHFLRELQSVQDNTSLKFPENIKNSIFKLKDIVDKGESINEAEELSLYLGYMNAVEEGIVEERKHYPFDPTSEGKPKRSKAYNLLKRLSRYEDVLKFFTERNAEIFTNNAAEREIRNVKVKSKIQGTFRSDLGPDMFCRIRGYIATMKKQGLNQFDALKRIFELEDIISLIAK